MFEKKIPDPRPGESQDAENGEDILRDLSWPELAAKLAAARDLRQEPDEPATTGVASFDADLARQLSNRTHGKPSVNPNGLAHGKQGQTYNAGAVRGAITGNRGS